MKNVLAVSVATLAMLSNCFGALTQGSVFLHTLRNSPKVSINDVACELKQGTLVEAKGLKIECGKNQRASIKFSNSVVLEIKEDSAIKIEEFTQEQPFKQNHFSNKEDSLSTLKITLEKGSVFAYSKKLRIKSKFKIVTKVGTFSINSTQFIMSNKPDGVEIFVLEGVALFKSPLGKSDFVRNKQKAILKNDNPDTAFPASIEQIGMLEEKKISEKIAPCRQVQKAVLFEFDSNKKLTAKRVILHEFLLNTPKYQHRN